MKTEPIPTSGAFRGSNFMTPDVFEYRRGTLRGSTVHIELSEGRWMGRAIFGVTFRYPCGTEPHPIVSKMVSSRAEIESYLAELPEAS